MKKLNDKQCIARLTKEYKKDENLKDEFFNDKVTDSTYSFFYKRDKKIIELIIDRGSKSITRLISN